MEQVTVLETRDVPVADIQPHPMNANRGNVAEIATRLREMGQYRTIVVHAPTGNILAGNSTFKAARDKLGWSHVRAELVNCTENRALEILAWDNRARDITLGTDEQSLLALLEEIEANGSLSTAGYDSGDVDDLRALLDEIAVVDNLPQPPEDVTLTPRKSLTELQEGYALASTRSVMLGYGNEEYVRVVEQLAEIGEDHDLKTNAQVVLFLIEFYQESQ
jgi:site-specific DNA-methyltransferase (adenine-specific)